MEPNISFVFIWKVRGSSYTTHIEISNLLVHFLNTYNSRGLGQLEVKNGELNSSLQCGYQKSNYSNLHLLLPGVYILELQELRLKPRHSNMRYEYLKQCLNCYTKYPQIMCLFKNVHFFLFLY